MTLSESIVVALFAAEALILLALILRRSRRRASNGPAAANGSVRRLQQDIRALTRQLGEAAEDLDRRMAERLTQLEELLSSAEARLGSPDSPRRAEGAPGATAPPPPAEAPEEHDTAAGPEDAPVPTGPERIRQLADQGLSSVQIARRIGRPVGEVELILSIHRAGSSRA